MVSEARLKKAKFMQRLLTLVNEYNKILVVAIDNVGGKQMQTIRVQLRGRAVMLMGKNTLMRKAIKDNEKDLPKLVPLLPYIKQNVGLIFTNGDVKALREEIEELQVPAAAKQGQVSDVKVVIPSGNTGMEPTKTSFFQALNIPTKITRGCVDITSDYTLLVPGQVVNSSDALLLKMMNIKPFTYGFKVRTVYDDGTIFSAAVLDLTTEDVVNKYRVALQNIASIGLATGIPNRASVPHSMANSLKELMAVSVSTKYFPSAFSEIGEYLADPSKFATAEPEKKKDDAPADDSSDSSSSSDGGIDLF